MDPAELLRLQESARLGEAARTALTQAESRWRQALGTAAQERLRLRAEIGVLRTPGALASTCVISGRLTKALTPSAASGEMR